MGVIERIDRAAVGVAADQVFADRRIVVRGQRGIARDQAGDLTDRIVPAALAL